MNGLRMIKRLMIALMLLINVACTAEVTAKAEERVNVFASEEEAAYEHALNLPASTPLASVPEGATVSVLYDTYGKDYWACYIRAPSGQEGWVLCTSLDYKRAH